MDIERPTAQVVFSMLQKNLRCGISNVVTNVSCFYLLKEVVACEHSLFTSPTVELYGCSQGVVSSKANKTADFFFTEK